MTMKAISEGWNELVDELKQLEAFFPMLSSAGDQDELEEEVRELEELIRAAGEPEDEHSLRALSYLQSELRKKRGMLERL